MTFSALSQQTLPNTFRTGFAPKISVAVRVVGLPRQHVRQLGADARPIKEQGARKTIVKVQLKTEQRQLVTPQVLKSLNVKVHQYDISCLQSNKTRWCSKSGLLFPTKGNSNHIEAKTQEIFSVNRNGNNVEVHKHQVLRCLQTGCFELKVTCIYRGDGTVRPEMLRGMLNVISDVLPRSACRRVRYV